MLLHFGYEEKEGNLIWYGFKIGEMIF